VDSGVFFVIRIADTPGEICLESASGRLIVPVDTGDFGCCFVIFNEDEEVDRRISDGVCVETLFMNESSVDDADFFIVPRCGDFDRVLSSSSLDSKVKQLEDDARSNPRLLFDV
jgi:hypothetical protein